MDSQLKQECIELLRSNRNLVLTGAPGTGKTHLAKQIAEQLTLGVDGHIGFVQFHPSYDYTDFVEGLRPTAPDAQGNIGFERKDGVFKEFCKKAAESLMSPEMEEQDEEEDDLIEEQVPAEREDVAKEETSSKGKSYNEIYNSIYNDIKAGKLKKLKRVAGRSIKQGRKHMKLFFVHFISHNIREVPKSRDLDLLIDRLTQGGTKAVDPTMYTGMLQEMLNRYYDEPTPRNLTPVQEYDAHKTLKAIDVRGSEPIAPESDTPTQLPFVFIIDEINRGELSKIFGELFFSIDPGYRGEKGRVSTQYQNMVSDEDVFADGFYIPENVYIIGTMNDIDRSVESMDFAIRRRFAWKEITAGDTMEEILSQLPGNIRAEAKRRMISLNEAIEQMEGLGTPYHIGAAYFLKLKEYDGDFDKLWDYHLQGLLFEYLRGTRNSQEDLETLKRAYQQTRAENGSNTAD
ncbi:MAG: AAA family ATPase [Prevotellaceae bacterium]|jgi:hypothetical protein|nr:AAA family ATPase [Prevotellaceae bacterium]